MNETYVVQVVNRSGQVVGEFNLPFLPRVGDNIILANNNFNVLNVTVMADKIVIQKANNSKILNPNAPDPHIPDNLIIPAVIFADITDLSKSNNEESEDKSDESSKSSSNVINMSDKFGKK